MRLMAHTVGSCRRENSRPGAAGLPTSVVAARGVQRSQRDARSGGREELCGVLREPVEPVPEMDDVRLVAGAAGPREPDDVAPADGATGPDRDPAQIGIGGATGTGVLDAHRPGPTD